MNLDDMTRDQLKEEAKNRGIHRYQNWDKNQLIQAITRADVMSGRLKNPADEANSKEVNAPKSELSPQAVKWQEYFTKTNITAADFLKRYPYHKFKVFISELL